MILKSKGSHLNVLNKKNRLGGKKNPNFAIEINYAQIGISFYPQALNTVSLQADPIRLEPLFTKLVVSSKINK